ncbi:MAG: TonB system transport protein ExbD [Gammaproteobacteria bacterium]|nr:MAG: TonB system transport protein ExbD [Gammaproteobacteria bacterium]
MKRFDQINVIPFIDIMLVMLAIVLTTATFIAQGTIPVVLPEAEHAESISDEVKFEIVVDDQGTIYHANEQLALSELDERLSEIDTKTQILLRVDSGSRFETFVSIVDKLKGYGLRNVSILSEKAL